MQKYQRRELLVTDDVRWFIEKCFITEECQDLLTDMHKALTARDWSGCITMSLARGFLLFTIEPLDADGPERVVVWHGPSDGGIFYTSQILERASPYEIGLA